jgi:hypothetical protein
MMPGRYAMFGCAAARRQRTSNSRPLIIPMSSDALQMVPPASGKRFISNLWVGSIPISHPSSKGLNSRFGPLSVQ